MSQNTRYTYSCSCGETYTTEADAWDCRKCLTYLNSTDYVQRAVSKRLVVDWCDKTPACECPDCFPAPCDVAERIVAVPAPWKHPMDHGKTKTVLVLPNGKRHGVSFVPRGQSARKTHGGPMVPGPWAFCFPLCVVLANGGGSGREAMENRAAGLEHDVKDGTFVEVDGRLYRVRVIRRDWIELDALDADLLP